MNNFLKNLIKRHEQPAGNIKPRLPGVFEPGGIISTKFSDSGENQSINSEREEKSDNLSATNTLNNRVEKVKKDIDFQRTPISNTESKGINPVSREGNKFTTNDKSDDPQISKQINPEDNPVLPEKRAFKNNTEKKESESKSPEDNQNTILNKFQIKPEIKPTPGKSVLPEGEIEKSMISDNRVQKDKILPGKKISPVAGRESSPKNERNGNTGLKLPGKFNTWLNTPVQNPQPNSKEVSSAQTIKVNIGRIEVRAVMDQGKKTVSVKPATKPKLSLEDYLNQRNGGKR
jgi:hypothetical protein